MPAIKTIKSLLQRLDNYLRVQTQQSQKRITLFGVVMMINFPLFGVLWKFDGFQFSEEFVLRLAATTFCAMLVFNRYWPQKFAVFFPYFWYFTMLYSLPFFFTYSALLNHGATTWLMNSVSAIFFLLLMTRVLDALVIFISGFGLAIFIYFVMIAHPFIYYPGNISLFSLSITYIAAMVIGGLFARDREISFAGQVSDIRNLAGSLAEDLRTPLESIYQQAELQELILSKLNNPEAQRDLKASLEKITRSVENSKQLINLQLDTMHQEKMDTSKFTIIPIQKLTHDTLEDYPLSGRERGLVHFDNATDFLIWVDALGFKNLLWNTFKQYYEPYRLLGRTELTIWMTQGEGNDDFNYLHVKSALQSRSLPKPENVKPDIVMTEKKNAYELAYSMLFLIAASGQLNVIEKSEKVCYVLIKFPKVD